MTINNKSERNYRGKCLGWPVTSYGGDLLYIVWRTSELVHFMHVTGKKLLHSDWLRIDKFIVNIYFHCISKKKLKQFA